MKIIHTADWHLGNVFHGHSRQEEHAHFLAWLLNVVRQRRPDALILSGDIFDSPNPPASAERRLYDFLTDVTTAVEGLQVVITAGNHDSGQRLEAPAELLRRSNVYVRGIIRRDEESGEPDFDDYILPLSALGDAEACIVCYAVPYLRTADYPAGLSATEGIAWFLDNLRRRHRKSDFRNLPVVVSAHFYAASAEVCASEHSERLVVGGQDCVDASGIDCGAAYIALGHIHKAQRVGDAKTEMVYAGSALPMSFAEKTYRHGVEWVDIDDEGHATVSRIDYAPLRRLMSIPATGAIGPDDVMAALAALPAREEGDDGAAWPYLDIHVLETQPQPSLMRDVAEALADRAVHFCRMVREVPESKRDATATPPDALRQMSPLDMAGRVFESRYAQPMPEPLATRFNEALKAVTAESAEA